MVPNDALTNRLRQAGYTFKRQTDRMMIWKQKGSTRRVMVRRNRDHDDDAVRVLLRQAGLSPDEIEAFIKEVGS